jgi:hypothetical protein
MTTLPFQTLLSSICALTQAVIAVACRPDTRFRVSVGEDGPGDLAAAR